jgi:hypothetical protein
VKAETKKALKAAYLEQVGFLDDGQLALLAGDDETAPLLLLVRCNVGRFLAPARYTAHYCKLIDSLPETAGEYVRDVSIPAGALAHLWAAALAEAVRPEPVPPRRRLQPEDADYGGAFDGVNVTSDADPGL